MHSLGLSRLAATESACGSFAEACDRVNALTGAGVGSRQVQELAVAAAADIDPFYRALVPQPCTDATLLVLSADGKGVVIRREATAKAAAAKNGNKRWCWRVRYWAAKGWVAGGEKSRVPTRSVWKLSPKIDSLTRTACGPIRPSSGPHTREQFMAAQTALTPEAAELAARHNLGALQSTFAPKRLNKLMLVVMWLAIAMFLSMFIIPGLVYLWVLRKMPDFNRKQAAKRLHLFENGMIAQPPTGEGLVAVRWDSVRLYQDIVQTYYDGSPAYQKCTYVALAPGASVTVTEFFENPETWGPTMQQAVVQAQGTKVLQEILAGATVSFGTFEVSSAGISTTHKGRLAWRDVQDIQLKSGWARVMQTNAPDRAWDSDEISRIANLYVFLAIARNFSAQ